MPTTEIPDLQLAPGNKIPGTRISVYEVYYWLVKGYDKAETMAVLPVTTAEYDFAHAYIEAHRDDVERVHQQIEERNARGNSPEVAAKLEAGAQHGRLLRRWLAAHGPQHKPTPASDQASDSDRNHWLRTTARHEFDEWLNAHANFAAAESSLDDRPAA